MANYGKYTGYEPAPDIPGAFNFQTADGKSMLAGGQAALDLKARLDAANAVTQTAGGKAAGGYPGDIAAEFGMKPPVQGGPPAPAPPPPQGDRPLIQNEINSGWTLDAQGNPYRTVAGSRGTSKEQLEKKATQGTAMPTSQSDSTTGGFAPNQEYLDSRREQTEATKGVANEARDAEITAQEQGRAVAGDQFVAQTAVLNNQKYLADITQAQVDNAQAVRDQAVKEYTGTKIDPDRVFAGGGGFAKRLGAALAAGVGAYGAAINHTQNFAGQVIDNMIERDIHAQEVDLRTKKDAADNALSDLVRRGMSLDQAKNTLGVIQKDWARQQLELAKGASGSDAINAKYDAHIAKLNQDQLDADEKYRQDALGKATKATAAQVVYPQAGSAGGRVYATPEERAKLTTTKTNTEGNIAGTAKTIGEIGKGGTGGKAGTMKAQKLADIAASEAQLAQFENTWVKAGKPGVFTAGYFGGDTSQDLGAQVDAMAPGLGRVQEGNAPNESTMAAIRSGMLSGDPTKMESTIRAQKLMLADRKKSIMEGPDDAPPEAPDNK